MTGSGGPRLRTVGVTAILGCALAAVVVLAGCSGPQGPQAATTSGAGTPTSAGTSIDSSPVNATAEVGRQVNLFLSPGGRYDQLIKSVLVNVDGQELFEHYSADSGPGIAHNLYSVTKSVMSMLVGIAIQEGLITSVDQTLAELLPADVPEMAPGVSDVTLRQLLTMTGGIAADEQFNRYTPDANWTKVTLATPLTQPAGTGFIYSSPGSHLLSAILVHATGRSVLDYAREKLFTPLGISTEPAAQPTLSIADLPAYDAAPGFGWSTDPQGLNLGLSDLKVTAPDMITLGRLYLQEGRWEGRQLVPAAWVRESTSSLVPTQGPVLPSDHYGYLWWIPDAGGHPAFAAMGHAGQLIEVVPDLKLVVAVSCLDGPAAFDASDFVDVVARQIVPAVAR